MTLTLALALSLGLALALSRAAPRGYVVIVRACTARLAALATQFPGVVARARKRWRQRLSIASAAAATVALRARLLELIAGAHRGVRRLLSIISRRALLVALSRSALDPLMLAGTAAWCHRLSVVCTALLLALSASLAGASTLLALLLWALMSLVSLAVWCRLEPFLLRRLGCRSPGHLERDRLDPALGCDPVEVLVIDVAQPWLAHGVRALVVSRALLDLLEDRALTGLLAQATVQVRAASLAGELVVWLGNLPLLGVWWLSRGLVQVARVLAIAVGSSLVLPMVLWPRGFTRWAGRLFGAIGVGLLGSAMLSSGLSAAGLGFLLAWAVVPGLQALLNWETRQAETAADDAAVASGRGWELLEALETLVWAESASPPAAPLGWLSRTATPLTERANRIWRKLAQP